MSCLVCWREEGHDRDCPERPHNRITRWFYDCLKERAGRIRELKQEAGKLKAEVERLQGEVALAICEASKWKAEARRWQDLTFRETKAGECMGHVSLEAALASAERESEIARAMQNMQNASPAAIYQGRYRGEPLEEALRNIAGLPDGTYPLKR